MFIRSNILDFLTFIIVSILTTLVFYFLMPEKPDFFAIVLFLFLLIPTVIALMQGAPFVPTPMDAGRKMIKVANIKKDDQVVDIGCGDGRLVYMAANENGAKAVGFELSPFVYFFAKVRQLFWRSRAKIRFGDFRMYNLSKTDYIVCYMLPETLKKFIPKFEKELKNGAKIISYAFKIAGWEPVHIEPSEPSKNISQIYVYEIGKQYKA